MSSMNIPLENLKALVVDDYETMRRKISDVLRKLGISVKEAENGIHALELLRKEKVDIVFTDIVMPEMDGFELCQEIRKSADLLDIPIVVTSTHCDSGYVIKALRMGADDYIVKPVEPQLIEKVINRLKTPALQE